MVREARIVPAGIISYRKVSRLPCLMSAKSIADAVLL